MNNGHPLNNGENRNKFPLVRKPASAVEKAAPGAKRILSGMVADTLALTKNKKRKKLRIVVLDDEEGARQGCVAMQKYWNLETLLTLGRNCHALTPIFS
jgi:hypothetical protein